MNNLLNPVYYNQTDASFLKYAPPPPAVFTTESVSAEGIFHAVLLTDFCTKTL